MKPSPLSLRTLVFLFLYPVPVLAQVFPETLHPLVRTISSERLEDVGAFRLSDLFSFLTDWRVISLEGYKYDVSVNGLAPLQTPGWLVFVDGQPVALDALGAKNINVLPLDLRHVARVEVLSTPAVYRGIFAPAGVLHLHTLRPVTGLSLEGRFTAGNEVGDPGPVRYTAMASPNIDRIGPHFMTSLSYARPGWFIRASLEGDEHHATDAQILERVNSLYTGIFKPRLLQLSPGILAGLDGVHGNHRLFGGHTRLRDLRFFDPFGQEVPVTERRSHVGISGTFPGPTTLSYRLSYNALRLGHRANKGNLDLDWRQDRVEANVEARFRILGRPLGLGVTYEYLRSRTRVPLRNPTLSLPAAYATLTFGSAGRVRQELSVHLTYLAARTGVQAHFAPGIVATTRLRHMPGAETVVTLSYRWESPEVRNSPWYWVAQGYAGFDEASSPPALPSFFVGSRTLTADVVTQWQWKEGISLSLSGGYRRFSGLTLASTTFHFNPATDGFTGPTIVHLGVTGQLLTASVRLRARPSSVLEQQLSYVFTRPVASGDVVFWEAWASQPWHQAALTVRYAPLSRLSLTGRLRVESATLWPAYGPAQAETGRYATRRPPYVRLDLSFMKRMWKDHLNAGFSLRNATNTTFQPHPAGAITRMTLFVSLAGRF